MTASDGMAAGARASGGESTLGSFIDRSHGAQLRRLLRARRKYPFLQRKRLAKEGRNDQGPMARSRASPPRIILSPLRLSGPVSVQLVTPVSLTMRPDPPAKPVGRGCPSVCHPDPCRLGRPPCRGRPGGITSARMRRIVEEFSPQVVGWYLGTSPGNFCGHFRRVAGLLKTKSEYGFPGGWVWRSENLLVKRRGRRHGPAFGRS